MSGTTLADGFPTVLRVLGVAAEDAHHEEVAFYAGAYLAIVLITAKDARGRTLAGPDGKPYLDHERLEAVMKEIQTRPPSLTPRRS